MSPVIIFILILLVVLLIVYLIRYTMGNTYSLQSGVKNGKDMTTFSAKTLASSETPSSNFAYSVWLYVNDWNYQYGKPKVLFGRMGSKSDTVDPLTGISGTDPCPLVKLGSLENSVEINLACFSTTDSKQTTIHKCIVSNIPIQRWVNLAVSVYGRTLDVYMNGKLVKTCVMPGIAKVNNNADVFLTPNGGFDGWTSKFAYFPMPINPEDAWTTYTKGPTGLMSGLSTYQVQLSLMKNGETLNSAAF